MTPTPQKSPAGYETSDASPAFAGLIASVILAGLVVVLGVAAWIDHRHAPKRPDRDPAGSFEHGPAVRTGIEKDWAEQDRLVREHLTTYGWVDRPAGIVRLPVEQAMKVIAAESAAAPLRKKKP